MNFDPDWTIAPGETLREWREELGFGTKVASALCAGMSREQYERIEAAKEPITPVIAAALTQGTGIPTNLWLNLERRYRADLKAGKIDASEPAPHIRHVEDP